MRFIIISDTHKKHKKINIPDGDVLIVCGDICTTGTAGQIVQFSYFIGMLPHKHKILIPGNHDKAFRSMGPHGLLPNGVSYLCDSQMRIKVEEGKYLNVYGMPWSPYIGDWEFMLPRDSAELERKCNNIPEDTDILITHCPPYHILDAIPVYDETDDVNENIIGYVHEGCKLLCKRVGEVKLKLHVFGHIHESYGYKYSEDTLFVNASICDGMYEPNNKPFVVDYIDGKFNVVE